MVRALVVASLFAAATAHAQAPGEVTEGDAAPPLAPPGMMMGPPNTPVDNPCACGGSSFVPVMQNRWAVGLSFGSLGIAPRDQPDNPSKFAIGGLSLRFRATLHLEIEASFAGGKEKLADGTDGTRQVDTSTLGLRYRFAAERPWNWWVMAGIGSLSITQQGATDQERQDARKPMGQLGIGIERRFRHFAINAELRSIGIGPDQNQPQTLMGGVASMTTNQPPPPQPQPAPSSQGQSGGTLTLGASYYF